MSVRDVPRTGRRDAVPPGIVLDRATGPHGALGTMVLLNSLGTTTALWDGVVPFLTDSFDVARFDQRGHGDAADRAAPRGIDELVDDVLRVVDGLGTGPVHLAGISIGGMIALRAARLAPDRVASLAVMCCAAVLDRRSWVERAGLVRREGMAAIVPPVLDRWFAPEFRRDRPEVVRAYADMLGSTDPEGYAVGCDVLAEADVRDDLGRIDARTLVLGGAEDPATPPHEQRAIARAMRRARLEILPGVAHLAPAAAPGEVAAALRAHALDRPGDAART
ncbi:MULTISPECIES: alpha/beta fold hydrolase [Actinomadura]|uniref:alpha/beta fold hydrolase n=1 Tax=Actinomadura TaxID=1988 RepID=UPI0003F819AC|nr:MULTISPECIES: alpha/beta fold hydrolase [Actinomadura]RSN72017.1 3-oxoadipate enol-lactonase [Actinomadura sp. WAC 06369]